MIIKFSHFYDKLEKDVFTTIRGKSVFDTFKVGKEFDIQIFGQVYFQAKIIRIEKREIFQIPLRELQEDCSPFLIPSHLAFLVFINRFRRFYKLKSVNEFVTVITLEKNHNRILS